MIKMVKKNKGKLGFTLVELMVVCAIVAVLAVVVVTSYAGAKAKSRDSRRIADLHMLKSALLLYKEGHGSLPSNPCGGAYCSVLPYANCNANCDEDFLAELLDENYINYLPDDPKAPDRRYWHYNFSGNWALISQLEVIQANTIADAFVIADTASGDWGCKMYYVRGDGTVMRNSYCLKVN